VSLRSNLWIGGFFDAELEENILEAAEVEAGQEAARTVLCQ